MIDGSPPAANPTDSGAAPATPDGEPHDDRPASRGPLFGLALGAASGLAVAVTRVTVHGWRREEVAEISEICVISEM